MTISKEALQQLYLQLDEEMRGACDRSLPFEEYLFDRFDRARSLSAGERSSIHHLSYIYGKVRIGSDTWVGPMTLLDGSGGLEIGDNCSITAGLHLYTHDTVKKRLTRGRVGGEKAPIKIGSSCYIGPQTVIASGVTLGDFCAVGSNSFVNESFASHSVLMGTPARLRGHVRSTRRARRTSSGCREGTRIRTSKRSKHGFRNSSKG
jgi:acetyltransferase-like isoleucine patch superfamily enzyme